MEDLLFERGIDICHETVRLWWNRFGPMLAGEIRRAMKDLGNAEKQEVARWANNDVLALTVAGDRLNCSRQDQ